jgi:hypothetical protein
MLSAKKKTPAFTVFTVPWIHMGGIKKGLKDEPANPFPSPLMEPAVDAFRKPQTCSNTKSSFQ